MGSEGELMLEWCSEKGAGSWAGFKDAHRWIFRDKPDHKPSMIASSLAALGHLEVDFGKGRWEIGPPVLVALPNAAVHAVLAGARSPALVRRFIELDEDDGLQTMTASVSQRHVPVAYFVGSDTWGDLEEAARRLSIPFEGRYATRSAESLPGIGVLSSGSSRPPHWDLEKYDGLTGSFRRAVGTEAFGLYRHDEFGRSRTFWLDAQGWHAIDLSDGRYLELRRIDRHVIRWERSGANGTLYAPTRQPLPAIQARVATMCSGLDAVYDAGFLRYENVPLMVAQQITRSLGQRLRDRRGRPIDEEVMS